MPRLASTSIDDIVQRAVQDVIARASRSIAASIAEMAAAELEEQLSVATKRGQGRGRGRGRDLAPRAAVRRPRREELTKWVADHRARRVPTFVIELTGGLDTKKKIVAKFGEDAVFEKGRPLPKPAKAA
jgi:hypothetical protein